MRKRLRDATITCLLALTTVATLPHAALAAASPSYEVYAIRYGTLKDIPVSALVPGADPKRKMNTALMVWLIRGGGHTILVDTGFYRERFIAEWQPIDYISPEKALAPLGLQPADITDIVISHLHWDHADGVDLFPKAHVWIQKDEYRYYTQNPAAHAEEGVFAEDLTSLIKLKNEGRMNLIEGDAQTVFSGVTVYIGGKHTYQSQFVAVNTGHGTVVLASDNVYLYENLEKHVPITETLDAQSNLRAQDRMTHMVTDRKFIIPGHDPAVFTKFPKPGNGIALIQ